MVAIALFFSAALTIAAPAPPVPSTNAPSPPAGTNAIAPAEIASQAEAVAATLENLEASLDVDETSHTIEGELPAFISLIQGKLDDTTNDLGRHLTLPRLHRLS